MELQALEEDLKTTSAQVSATAEEVDELEAEKRSLEPGDPRRIELSDKIERLASRLRRQTAIEGSLTREVHHAATDDTESEDAASDNTATDGPG